MDKNFKGVYRRVFIETETRLWSMNFFTYISLRREDIKYKGGVYTPTGQKGTKKKIYTKDT
jgi:hypothetical protein